MSSGVAVNPQVDVVYQEIKLGHKHRFVIYKLNDSLTEIVVDKIGEVSSTYDNFLAALPSKVAPDCRYAVFDFIFEEDGGMRNKLAFIAWSPENAKLKSKMVYSASKDAIRKKLVGVAADIQATDNDEIAFDTILGKLQKKQQDKS